MGLSYPGLLSAIPPANFHEIKALAHAGTVQDDLIFTVPQELHWSGGASGWQELAGRWVYLLRMSGEGARGGGIILDKFSLGPTDRVYLYDIAGRIVYGAFSGGELQSKNRFFAGLLPGNEWLVEVVRSGGPRPIEVPLHVARVDMVPEESTASLGFDDSGECQINVACPEGEGYRDQQRAVVRILMVLEEGMGWCSGSLLNNTRNDGRPYILTAFHCQDGYTPEYDLWRFDFNYESPACDMPALEPDPDRYVGASFRAGRRESDFLLLELKDSIRPGSDVWFSGWSRSTLAPENAALIHHPAGDIKKVSLEEDPVLIHNASLKWSNGTITPKAFHFQAILDKGSMEPGSSGAPFFDQEGYIVGQLHGGSADCETRFLTYHGRLVRSWIGGGTAETRLSDWLDPLGLEPVRQKGIDNPNKRPLIAIEGRVQTARGEPAVNVEVRLTGGEERSMFTGADGSFLFDELQPALSYSISFHKENFPANGVTAQDATIIRKHLLGIAELSDPMALKAADTNGSGSVSVSDITQIIKLLLGLSAEFTQQDSWQFFPEKIDMGTLDSDKIDISVTAVKTGDVNFTANPGM